MYGWMDIWNKGKLSYCSIKILQKFHFTIQSTFLIKPLFALSWSCLYYIRNRVIKFIMLPRLKLNRDLCKFGYLKLLGKWLINKIKIKIQRIQRRSFFLHRNQFVIQQVPDWKLHLRKVSEKYRLNCSILMIFLLTHLRQRVFW